MIDHMILTYQFDQNRLKPIPHPLVLTQLHRLEVFLKKMLRQGQLFSLIRQVRICFDHVLSVTYYEPIVVSLHYTNLINHN